METLLKDVRHSIRSLIRNPAFSLAALAALALGIGVNTAIFSVVNAVLLKPVALPDSERIVLFQNANTQNTNRGSGASPAKFAHWAALTDVVEHAAAFRTGRMNLTGGTFPEELRWGQVSSEFFTLTGGRMRFGRPFNKDDDQPNGPNVVVLDGRLWETRFQSDPGVVGRAISLGGEPFTVIGVLDDFDFREFGPQPQIWTPFHLDPNTKDQGHYFQAAARLRPGVTLLQADTRLAASMAQFKEKFPSSGIGPNGTFGVQPIREVLVRNVRQSLFIMAGAVGMVLLIACANVANLLLVRATGRKREIAIRAAIGGTRGRIIRQLLTESTVLSLTGGILGLGLGWLGIRALLAINTADLPRVGPDGSDVGLDWRVTLFTIGVSVITGVIFGLIPALQSARINLTNTLKDTGGRSGTGARQNYARSVLVVVEVALALVLLIGSGLLIRTAVALSHVDPGFDAQRVLTMRMSLAGPQFAKSEAVQQMITNAGEQLKAVPGVQIVSATCCVPLTGGYGLPFRIVGRPLEADAQGPFHGGGGWTTVSPGYFEVFSIPMKRGRSFNERDTAAAAPVAIINQAMADQYWKDKDPLADRLVIGKGVMREFEAEGERQIIGVVANTRDGGLDEDPQPQMFIPQAQVPDLANALNVSITPMAWVIRTQGDPRGLATPISEKLRQATGLPVSDVRPMRDVVSLSTSRQTFNMWLMSVFGASALLLAAIGIYGLMAYSVEQRTQEIGIRLALGADASQVRRMVVRQGLVLAIIGIAIGMGAAFGLVRLATAYLPNLPQNLLYGVTLRDPLVFTGVPIVLTLVAILAIWIPALRASRVDPLIALRSE